MFDFHNDHNQLDHLRDKSRIKTTADLLKHQVQHRVDLR
jgi:hypothetical protein